MDILNILKTIHYFFNDYKISIKFVHFHSNIDWFARERVREREEGNMRQRGEKRYERERIFPFTLSSSPSITRKY